VIADVGALVHYFSPFASPAWLPGWQAREYLDQDNRRWSKLEELGMVSTCQRTAGPPRIAGA
jgi:hypothetical protein